jgi:molecular chaperone GrpE
MRSSPGTEHDSPADQSADELRAEVEQARAQLAETEDRYLRARADLDNYRKRAERELERRIRDRGDDQLRAWLEVVDSVERALALESDPRAADGLRAVLDQMTAILARQGLARVGQVGDAFDPERHEAIAVVPGGSPGSIAEIARPGYATGDRVVRPAQVAVARAPDDGD